MPYQIVKRENGYYVYKEDADGRPTGDAKNSKPYRSKKAANPYLRALYAAERQSAVKELSEMSSEALQERRNDVYSRYHALVNMSASELETWADTEASKRASVDRSPIARNLRLLRKSKDEWTANDVADANRTISFISRMRKVKGGQRVSEDVPYSKKEISLRNWAYKISEMDDEGEAWDDTEYDTETLDPQSEVGYTEESPHPDMRCANCAYFSRDGQCAAVEATPTQITESGYCEAWAGVEDEEQDVSNGYPYTPSLNPYPMMNEFSTRVGRADEYVREYELGNFRGRYPDVPTSPKIDVAAIRKDDPKPFYVVLPIFEVGRVSNNNLRYTREFCEKIVDRINDGGVVGIRGHIPKDQLTTSYPLPAVYWVGATIVGDKGWGKFYVPPGEHREHYRVLVNTGGEEATSIYGKPTRIHEYADGTYTPDLPDFQLDLAPPDRASLQFEDRRFYVTAEMTGEDNPMSPDDIRSALLGLSNDALMEMLGEDRAWQIAEMCATKKQKKMVAMEMTAFDSDTIAEFEGNLRTRDTRIAELTDGINQRDGVIAELRSEIVSGKLTDAVTAATDWQVNTEKGQDRLSKLRAAIYDYAIAEMGSDLTAMTVDEAVSTAMRKQAFIVEMARDALSGGDAGVGGNDNRRAPNAPRLSTEDEMAEARAKFGI